MKIDLLCGSKDKRCFQKQRLLYIFNQKKSLKISKMNHLQLFLLLSLMAFFQTAEAQDIAYGFKAGLNFNRIIGDSETDGTTEYETFDGKTGFHVGATFSWKATDLMGVRGEFLFSQKGYKRRYNGPSYYDISTDNGTRVSLENGNRNIFISNANSYIDIPVMGYVKVTKWLELHVGANVGIMLSSTAVGDFIYTGQTPNGSDVTIEYDLDYSYGSDDVGEVDVSAEPVTIAIDNGTFTLPNSAGAYYEYESDEGRYYNLIDLGLVGGMSFYLNKGLYVALRANYGLTDITNDDADYSFLSKDANGDVIKRNEKDRNFSVQASVGFSF
ncbi:MAG: hypothetical protein ACI9XO_000489 [Paraglaciecola sp.]|jgi:hypothetical protein